MCGICGLVAPPGVGPPEPALVDRMCSAIVHRGPDDGSAVPFDRCVLGHRRLRVIDFATGYQPVSDESGEIVAVFNGEIYNFQELRRELAAAGHDVRGTGDTPIIPHLYEEHGPRFVERLEGMFAIALWDGRRGRLVLARDRVGKKPLLWARLGDGTLAFASELKALVQLPGLRREVDPVALDGYLALQYVPEGRTGLRNVHKLPPGHILVDDGGGERVERYWRLEPQRHDYTEGEWLVRAHDAVEQAVRRRLVADVPVGALLSGGIDSSIVVALMAKASSDPVRTFTVGFSDARYDEREHARAVAERYGTVHEELVLEPDATALLPQLAWAYDEPFGDASALPTFLVCELAQRSVTVALTGDGGDEAFAGYERYLAHRAAGQLSALPAALPRFAARSLRLLPAGRQEPRSPLFRLARFLEMAASPPLARYGLLMEVFPAPLRAALWTPGFLAELGGPRSASDVLGPPPAEGIAGLQMLDVETYLSGDLLVKADIASMANSLELRSPFLDHHVLELGISMPDGLRVRGRYGKEALRRAFAADLPPQIVGRAKKGFDVPLARWFRTDLRDFAGDILLDRRTRERGQLRPEAIEALLAEHTACRADHGHRLWCLVMLELWQRLYVESERPPVHAGEATWAAT